MIFQKSRPPYKLGREGGASFVEELRRQTIWAGDLLTSGFVWLRPKCVIRKNKVIRGDISG